LHFLCHCFSKVKELLLFQQSLYWFCFHSREWLKGYHKVCLILRFILDHNIVSFLLIPFFFLLVLFFSFPLFWEEIVPHYAAMAVPKLPG
jgi:hypothetical protein